MSNDHTPAKPYISPHDNVPETTLRAVIIGLVLAIVMGAANTYLGLYAGMTVSASIPAAVVSMAILKAFFRGGTILENNIAQTMASTGESLAAGVIFTVPALVLVGAWQDFKFWPTTLIVMFGGLLGIVFMIPMRRALIAEETELIYPEGVACAEVLIVGQEGGAGIGWIGLGLGVGAIFKFLIAGLGLVKGTVEGAVAMGRSIFYGGSDMTVALLAVGYIVNLSIASQVFLGGVIAWVIALPLLSAFDGEGAPLDAAWEIWSTQIRYIGVGAMLVGGLYSIWSVRKGILGGISSLRGAAGSASATGGELLRTERNIPFTALLTLFFLSAGGTFGLYTYLVGSVAVSLVATGVMIVAAFLFVAVATYIAGLVGSSNSPVSGMTICALLMAAGVLMALGIKGDSAILATLGVAGVVCCAACTAGDVAQDLKTGLIVGATPARQQWTEILAVVVPAFFFAPILSLLHHSYGIGDGLRAPQAALFASLTAGFFGSAELPWNLIAIGAAIGLVLIVFDTALVLFGTGFRAHIMPIAVGMYLPLSIGVPIFIGGLIRYFTSRTSSGATANRTSSGATANRTSSGATANRTSSGATAAHDSGILFGSGLIAGEALMGIGLAIPITLGFTMWDFNGHWSISLFIMAAIILAYILIARTKTRSA